MPLDSDEGEEENNLKKTNPEDLNNHKNPNEQETKTEREYPSQKFPPTITQTQTKNENLYQFYINNNEGNASDYKFKDNKIDTTKYNIFTFLPKVNKSSFISSLSNSSILEISVRVSAIESCLLKRFIVSIVEAIS
jgi:transposase